MPLVVEPVKQVDIQAATDVYDAAFGSTSCIHKLIYPNGATPAAKKDMLKTFQGAFDDSENTCLKVVDTSASNKLVAWIDWKVKPRGYSSDTKPGTQTELPNSEADDSTVEETTSDINRVFSSTFFGSLAALKSTHLQNKPHVHIGILCADPSYRGLGSGSLLLARCAEVADELKLPIVLEASPLAYKLYIREGYIPVPGATGELDLQPFGGDGSHTMVMVERPVGGGDNAAR